MAALIVGAGPAGCAAAITLARGGSSPLIREQTTQTGDALCGGFLSWRTLRSLETLGIDATLLGGHRVNRVSLYSGRQRASASLPAPGIGLSRHRLDTVMLDRAIEEGARIERGVRLLSVDKDGTAHFDDGGSRNPESLFLANGKHDVRGLPRREARSIGDLSIGIRVRLGPHPALGGMIADTIELHLFDRGYGGLILQEDSTANLCIAVRKSALARFGGQPGAFLEHLASKADPLAKRLSHWDRSATIDTIGAVPYGWRARETSRGRFLLGDQAACIPSLAGEGIGLAIASGMMAADFLLADGADGAISYQRSFAAAAARPVNLARAIWYILERPASARLAISAVNIIPSLANLTARLTRIGDF